MHTPVLQTPPGHVVPFMALEPLMHRGIPAEQSVVPNRHGSEFPVHGVPAGHAVHVPALQTPAGQAVPFGFGAPLMHIAMPEPQSMEPKVHAELGLVEQPPSWLHALQKPLLHTPPTHGVPFIRGAASWQTGWPVLHRMTPRLHRALGLVVHVAPSLQGVQVPLRHTPEGQLVPLGLFEPLAHVDEPDAQSVTPF
jgi:hypothetical protein